MTSLRGLLNDRGPGFSRLYKTLNTKHNQNLGVRSGKSVYANGPVQESKKLMLNIDRLDGIPPAKRPQRTLCQVPSGKRLQPLETDGSDSKQDFQ